MFDCNCHVSSWSVPSISDRIRCVASTVLDNLAVLAMGLAEADDSRSGTGIRDVDSGRCLAFRDRILAAAKTNGRIAFRQRLRGICCIAGSTPLLRVCNVRICKFSEIVSLNRTSVSDAFAYLQLTLGHLEFWKSWQNTTKSGDTTCGYWNEINKKKILFDIQLDVWLVRLAYSTVFTATISLHEITTNSIRFLDVITPIASIVRLCWLTHWCWHRLTFRRCRHVSRIHCSEREFAFFIYLKCMKRYRTGYIYESWV